MDYGHYNCRDYHIEPHLAPTTISKILTSRTIPTPSLARHESFQELEQRSRSPPKAKFPLLRLPLELRQHIFSYLLPTTLEHSDPNPLASHARNFSAVKKRSEKGMVIPAPGERRGPTHVVWRRGNVHLLSVCRQIHDECADLLYGSNTFLLFVTYSGITFRFSWLLKSGFAPNRRYNFLELLPKKYLCLLRRVIVNVDHVDNYTGMIKFNVSGKGLTAGLKRQCQRLVNALQPPSLAGDGGEAESSAERRLTRVTIRVSNGNSVVDQLKSESSARQREGGSKVNEDLEEMLEPFSDLRGVREVAINGAVNESYARSLEAKMQSLEKPDMESMTRRLHDLEMAPPPQMCVYGNDMT